MNHIDGKIVNLLAEMQHDVNRLRESWPRKDVRLLSEEEYAANAKRALERWKAWRMKARTESKANEV